MFGTEVHGHGELHARWTGDDEVLLQIRPLAPRWFAERPMDSRVHFRQNGAVELYSYRVK